VVVDAFQTTAIEAVDGYRLKVLVKEFKLSEELNIPNT